MIAPRAEEGIHAGLGEAGQAESAESTRNVGQAERILSTIAGGALALQGLSSRSAAGLLLAALGGTLIYRGITGRCPVYRALGIQTAGRESGPDSRLATGGVKVERAITVSRPRDEVYRFWRNLENLPRVFEHVESVKVQGNRSHWVVKAPLGATVEWDAEIINEDDGRLIAWKSLEGSQVDSAGSVHFEDAPGGATEIRVTLKYNPPAGKLGAGIARLLGEDPEHQIDEDLRRFRETLEAGSAVPAATLAPGT